MSNRRLRVDFERILWCVALLGIALFFIVRARRTVPPLAPLSPAVRDAMVAANNDFGFQLFPITSSQPGAQSANIIFSPANLEVGLGMIAQGARGATRAQMDAALQWQQFTPTQRSPALQALAGDVFAADAQVPVTPANALWVDKSLVLSKGFIKANASFYSTKIRQLRFADPNAVSTMNRWVGHETHAKIPAMASVGDVRASTRLVALNAMTVKANWMERFDPNLTKEEAFISPVGTTTSVKMMHRDGVFLYAEDDTMQVVKLPCGEGKVSMVLVLPRMGQRLDSIRQTAFTPTHWPALLARLRAQDGQLALPRCKITSNLNLQFELQALGMSDAFNAGKADFSALSASPCCLSQVMSRVEFEMTESGDSSPISQAKHEIAGESLPSNNLFTMIVNRPFLFAYLSIDGAVLLMGSVATPV